MFCSKLHGGYATPCFEMWHACTDLTGMHERQQGALLEHWASGCNNPTYDYLSNMYRARLDGEVRGDFPDENKPRETHKRTLEQAHATAGNDCKGRL